MDTVVLKFGGSSLANNERLMMVANKIIEKAMKHKVVVVVSAQGKTTDNLLKQAKESQGKPSYSSDAVTAMHRKP